MIRLPLVLVFSVSLVLLGVAVTAVFRTAQQAQAERARGSDSEGRQRGEARRRRFVLEQQLERTDRRLAELQRRRHGRLARRRARTETNASLQRTGRKQ